VSDVLERQSVRQDEVVMYRWGMNNRYCLRLSPDHTQIVSGRIPWAPDWTSTGRIEGR
jgi:hypothetical protein